MKSNQSASNFIQLTTFQKDQHSRVINCLEGQTATHACLSKSCQLSAFVCKNQTCKCQDFHKNCWLVQAKNILQSLQKKVISLLQLQTVIEEGFQKIIDQLSSERDQILSIIKSNKSLIGLNPKQKDFLALINEGKCSQITGSKISNIYSSIEDKSQLRKIYDKSLEDMEAIFKQFKQKIDLPKKIKKILYNNLNFNENCSFDKIRQIQKQIDFRFSQQLRAKSIKITQNMAQKTGSSQQQFALIQPSLQQCGKINFSKEKRISLSLRIKSDSRWIGVGICLKQKIKKSNYQMINHSNIGHGFYFIAYHGYSYSHSDKQINALERTFKFSTNDIIHIDYDREHSLLRFSKNQGIQTFEMSIAPALQNDQYYFCVVMWHNNNSVQILDEKQMSIVQDK